MTTPKNQKAQSVINANSLKNQVINTIRDNKTKIQDDHMIDMLWELGNILKDNAKEIILEKNKNI